MKIYVVVCRVDGCDECGTSVHVVAANTDYQKARDLEEKHYQDYSEKKLQYHLHQPYVEVYETDID